MINIFIFQEQHINRQFPTPHQKFIDLQQQENAIQRA